MSDTDTATAVQTRGTRRQQKWSGTLCCSVEEIGRAFVVDEEVQIHVRVAIPGAKGDAIALPSSENLWKRP